MSRYNVVTLQAADGACVDAPLAVLTSVSPVFEIMLTECAHDNVVQIADTSGAALRTFIQLASLMSYGSATRLEDAVRATDAAVVRLVHKYDASGILGVLRDECQRLKFPMLMYNLVSIFDDGDDGAWLDAASMDALVAHVMDDGGVALTSLCHKLLVRVVQHLYARSSTGTTLQSTPLLHCDC